MAAQQQQQASLTGGRRKVAKSNYNVFGVLVIALAVGAFFLGQMGIEKATAFRQEMEELEAKKAKAISDKATYAREIQQKQGDMQLVQQRASTWRNADKKLNRPYALSTLGWIEAKAKDQKPQLTATNTNSDDTKKPGTVTMQVSGDFKSLLNWIMESEHDLDAIRIVKANWKAKSSQAVELTLNIEVDNNE